ncbi:MAG: TonB-dependent receptor [Hyphomonas sp.]
MRPAIRRPRSLRMPVTMCAAIVVGAATPALADDSGEPELRNETITVTDVTADTNPYGDPDAPYRAIRSASGLFTEDLLDTPKSITVITDETLHDLGAKSFRDLFRAQPGITLGTGEGGNAFGDRIFIRGFDARNDVYVDGVRDRRRLARDIRRAAGGNPQRPLLGLRRTRHDQRRGQPRLQSPARATGATLNSSAPAATAGDPRRKPRDPATRSLPHQCDDARFRDCRARPCLQRPLGHRRRGRWRRADLRLRLLPSVHRLPADWGHPYDVENQLRPFAVRRDNFYPASCRATSARPSPTSTGERRWVISPAIEFDTILRYGQSKNAYTASAPERPDAVARTVSANAKRRDAVTDYWTNQSRFTFRFDTGAIGHTLVTGIELSREETLNRTRAFTECATLPCIGTASNPLLDLDHPDNTIPWGSDTEVTGRPTITTETAALYALDTLTFSPQWEAFVGIRADSYSADTSGLTPERNSDSDFVNWHAGLVYKPIENASIYGSFSSASNPPCEQLDAFALDYGGCDALVAAMDPVENNSLELGAKYNLGGHLDLTAAVFQITRDGVPISNGRGATTAGSQDQEVQGVEFGVAGNLTDKWSLFGGLTLFETEITDSTDATQIGEMFPNVSEQSFTLTSRYQITHRFHLGGTAGYNTEKFGGTVAAGSTFVPDYWRFDFFGGYQIADNMEVTFNILNATDELYYDALYRSGTPFSYVAPGRSALVTLDIDF